MDSTTYMQEQQRQKYEECIICFESHTSDYPIYCLKDIPSIIITCDCQYKCHIRCFYQWLENGSRCLLCNKEIIKIPSIFNKNVTQISPFYNMNNLALSVPLIQTDEYTQIHYSPPPPYTIAVDYKRPEITFSSETPDNIIMINSGGAQDAGAQDAGAQDAGAQDAGAQDADAQDADAQEVEIIDGGSFKCCCIILTLATFGVVIEYIF